MSLEILVVSPPVPLLRQCADISHLNPLGSILESDAVAVGADCPDQFGLGHYNSTSFPHDNLEKIRNADGELQLEPAPAPMRPIDLVE